MTKTHKIAWLGLGAMGLPMVRHLCQAGYDVTVYNRSPERAGAARALGAKVAATPAEAVAQAQVVCSMVRDMEASRAVWLDSDHGAMQAMGKGALVMECSTLHPEGVRVLQAAAHQRGLRFMDAPVVGTLPQARAGALVFLASGDEAALEYAKPLMDLMGGAMHWMGPASQGTWMKLAVNSYFAVQVAAMGELLGALPRRGLLPQRGLEVLQSLPITSPALAGLGEMMLSGQFAPMFPMELVEKDLRYMQESAQSAGARVPQTECARQSYALACERGHGGDNIHGVVALFTQ